MDQIEFANVILISKADLVSSHDISQLTGILKGLNPEADIIPMVMGQAPLAKVLSTGLFDFDQAVRAPGWLKELRGEHTPETEEYGISSFVYRAQNGPKT